MTSEAQKNAGYLIPDPITGYELLCVTMFIPNDPTYIAAFKGQMWDLGTWFTWDKSYMPGDTRASQAAAYWRYLLDTYLCVKFNQPKEDDGMPCCDDNPLLGRFTSDGVYQTSSDGGETWEDNPDADPRNAATQAPPLGGSGDSTKCAAADNVRDTMKAYKAQLRSLLEAGTTVLAVVAGLIGALGLLLGLTGVALPISVLLFGMAAALLSLTPEELDDALTDAVFDDFRCLVYCVANPDGTFDHDDWASLIEQIDSTFSGFPQQFFHSLVAAMGYIGLCNAATIGAATASDCEDCDCPVECGDPAGVTCGTVIESGIEAGRKYLIIASESCYGSYQSISWFNYGNTSPPAPSCYISQDEIVSGSYSNSVWTAPDGTVHESSNPGLATVSHFGFNTSPGDMTPFTMKIVF